MSRVFVAEEVTLGRGVVRVLAPDLAEGLSTDRFAREAMLRWAITSNPMEASVYATYLREQGRLGAAVGAKAELEKLERQSAGR